MYGWTDVDRAGVEAARPHLRGKRLSEILTLVEDRAKEKAL